MILTDIDLIPFAHTEFVSDDFHSVRYGLLVEFGDVSMLISRENDSAIEGSVFDNGNWHMIHERELAIYSRLFQLARKLGHVAYSKWLRTYAKRMSDGKWDLNVALLQRKPTVKDAHRRN